MHACNFKTNCRPDHVSKFFLECWRKFFFIVVIFFYNLTPLVLAWRLNKQKLQFFFTLSFWFQQWWNALVLLVFLERCIQILCKTGKCSYFLSFCSHTGLPFECTTGYCSATDLQGCLACCNVTTWLPVGCHSTTSESKLSEPEVAPKKTQTCCMVAVLFHTFVSFFNSFAKTSKWKK